MDLDVRRQVGVFAVTRAWVRTRWLWLLVTTAAKVAVSTVVAVATIATFATPADMDLASPVFNSHQKCASGNKKMIYYIASRFRLPAKFEDYIYLSQVCQSECVADATEYWRRNRGRCNGSLYWQLNDCWPVCSWSGLDYGGNLKCLHYRAKEFFAPLSASVYTDKKTLRVWVLNDTAKTRRLTLRLTVVNMDGTGEAFERTADFEAPALESREVLALPLTIGTLGIFYVVVNAMVLELASFLSRNIFHAGIAIESFGSALVGAVIISIVSMLVGGAVGEE